MTDVIALLREPFVQDALKAALIIGTLCAFLGVYVVLKRIVFVGAALAEISSLGAAVAFLPIVFERLVPLLDARFPGHGEEIAPLILSLAAVLLGVWFFARQSAERRIPRESVIGFAYVAAAGLALLLLSKSASGDVHAMQVLQGNILGVPPPEIPVLGGVAAAILGVQLAFLKEMVLVSFDPEIAATQGYRARRWELLFYLSLGLAIAAGIHVAGTLLVFAYLVLPAICGLMLARTMRGAFLGAIGAAWLATLGGVLLSVSPLDLPTSPAIIGTATALTLIAVGIGRWRRSA